MFPSTFFKFLKNLGPPIPKEGCLFNDYFLIFKAVKKKIKAIAFKPELIPKY